MTDAVSFSSIELTQGVMPMYITRDPKNLIVKIKAVLDGDDVTLSAVVNVGMTGEIYLNGFTTLVDGDRIYAEPDGLTILESNANVDQINKICDQHILLAVYTGGTLMTFQTVEP